MIDLFAFFWGVLCGQGSFVIAFLLAKDHETIINSEIWSQEQGGRYLMPEMSKRKGSIYARAWAVMVPGLR